MFCETQPRFAGLSAGSTFLVMGAALLAVSGCTDERRGFVQPDCPPHYDSPVSTPQCSSRTEDIAGKFTAASAAAWAVSSGANRVIVAVRRDKDLCPAPVCPDRGIDCPENARYWNRVAEETQASQSCVRALIATIGGTASSEVFVLGNGFPASLTWSQIQTVAAHPDVLSLERAEGGNPPP